MSAVEPRLMQRALALAERGWGSVQPNPLVGALLVRDGEVIAEGWHATCGGLHAEAAALQAAGAAARGATLYVTLEPCAHTGRTPPCTEAIIAAGVPRVVIAARDPNPEARGGAERLRAAGIDVTEGVEAAAAQRQNAPFFHWHEHGTPWLALKLALALDGAIARRDGPRLLITGEAARAEANRLRAGFDAVMIGLNTALRDDPLLTVREHQVRVPPTRVVLDSQARLPPGCRLLRTSAEAPVLVFTSPEAPAARTHALRAAGAEVVAVPRGSHGLEVTAVLRELGERACRAVLCEGGARLARALLEADRVERLYLFLAPRILGPDAVKLFDPWPHGRASTWRLGSQATYGQDLELVFDRNRSSQ